VPCADGEKIASSDVTIPRAAIDGGSVDVKASDPQGGNVQVDVTLNRGGTAGVVLAGEHTSLIADGVLRGCRLRV
jgi:hypothetical protein